MKKREIQISPSDPGSVRILFLVIDKEENKAVQLLIMDSFNKEKRDLRTSYGPIYPYAADLGYHSPKPIYEDQPEMPDGCKIIKPPCYYDGSGLNAEPFLEYLKKSDLKTLWSELEAYFDSIFGKENEDNSQSPQEG